MTATCRSGGSLAILTRTLRAWSAVARADRRGPRPRRTRTGTDILWLSILPPSGCWQSRTDRKPPGWTIRTTVVTRLDEENNQIAYCTRYQGAKTADLGGINNSPQTGPQVSREQAEDQSHLHKDGRLLRGSVQRTFRRNSACIPD